MVYLCGHFLWVHFVIHDIHDLIGLILEKTLFTFSLFDIIS